MVETRCCSTLLAPLARECGWLMTVDRCYSEQLKDIL